IPFTIWGPVLRVLEDADLFAPYAGGPAPGNTACMSGVAGPLLERCFGVLFITPINFLWIIPVLVGFARIGERAWKVSLHQGPWQGLRFHALVLVAAFSLYLAWWASAPAYVRFLPSPLIVLVALVPAYVVVHVDARTRGWLNWRWCMFAYGLVPALVGVFYVAVWLAGGRGDWAPTGTTRPWVLLTVVLAPSLIVWQAHRMGRILGSTGRRARSASRPLAFFVYLLLLGSAAAWVSVLGAGRLLERGFDVEGALWVLAGPAVAALCVLSLRRGVKRGMRTHASFLAFTGLTNLLLVWGQAADGLMTALGMDVFGAGEKHVVPRTLIEVVRGWGLPDPFGAYAAALVMIPYKIGLSVLLVWALDVWNRELFAKRPNLRELLKLAAWSVGIVPGFRDALRLAMGV
ncbi:MAG: DUF63 family protein, partial [Euryarchaeota archaeon]|nr:DUF63 family protein [Euryarchaeota archaeon]